MTPQPEYGYSRRAEYILYLVLPKKDRESVPGDLAEEYETVILPRFGPRRAKWWYWKQVLFSIGPILWGQFRKTARPIAIVLFGPDSIAGITEVAVSAVSSLRSLAAPKSRTNVDTDGDLYIEAEMKSSIEVRNRGLIVGPEATVFGNVTARRVTIFGKVHGNASGETIEIRKNGSLFGDIETARVVIEDGAVFRGSIDLLKLSKGKETKKQGTAS